MINRVELIPVTETSKPFASAVVRCGFAERGYEENEYYLTGTAHVYETGPSGKPVVGYPDAPYVNRMVVRGPVDPAQFSGNVVVEIINPTSGMEIDRMWILAHRHFMRDGDVYVGITSKPNTLASLVAYDAARYGCLKWKNPTPERTLSQPAKGHDMLPPGVHQPECETGLFWDMLTDLAHLLRSDRMDNPLASLSGRVLFLTGWSQSGVYMTRYMRDFAFRDGASVFDGYLSAGPVHAMKIPLNQYELHAPGDSSETRVRYSPAPYIVVQTESENAWFNGAWTRKPDSDDPDFLYRLYEVSGASHDTVSSYVDYYAGDADIERIGHLPAYIGQHAHGNDYPSELLFHAAYQHLFDWVRHGAAPQHCPRIQLDASGENVRDVFGHAIGGLRTCLLDFPTARYGIASRIPMGSHFLFPDSDRDLLFGYVEPFSAAMLQELYGSLAGYRQKVVQSTRSHVASGYLLQADAEAIVTLAVRLAEERGLI